MADTHHVPSPTYGGITFIPVPEFSAIDAAFGADISRYLKRGDEPDIPREFIDHANRLFFEGGRLPPLADDVDKRKANTAIRAWLCSFAPSHEAKVATVGYAFWVWSPESGKIRAEVRND